MKTGFKIISSLVTVSSLCYLMLYVASRLSDHRPVYVLMADGTKGPAEKGSSLNIRQFDTVLDSTTPPSSTLRLDSPAHNNPVGRGNYTIPKIIHQTWDSYYVPKKFASWIKSWTQKNPDWEYWFWTPDAVRLLIKKALPEYLGTYNNYKQDVFRANSMRYLIMYYVGGVYADLDLENFRSLNSFTPQTSCFASEDAHVHAFIVNHFKSSPMMITILGCRPGHPYYKLAIDDLPSYTNLTYNHKLVYAQSVLDKYLKTNQSGIPGNQLDLVHPDVFMGSYDQGWTTKVRSLCRDTKLSAMKTNQRKTCEPIMKKKFANVPNHDAYSNHHWVHVVMQPSYYKTRSLSVPIFDLVPRAINVTKMIEEGKLQIKPFPS